jgi:hypothetical protein
MAEVWTETQDQEYYAAYIYPRARVFLDVDELQLSSSCEEELRKLELAPSFQSLQQFYAKFGHVFVTSVLLGGQQKTTKFAGALNKQDNAKQQDAIRWAVGAKVNAPYANIGAQYSREKGSAETVAEKDYVDSSYLALSATGGDTLLGSDIPKWAPTIAPFKNWRVVKNEVVLPIHDVVGATDQWKHIPQLFRDIHNRRPVTGRPWKGRFSLWYEGQPLYWDRAMYRLSPLPQGTKGSERAIFSASNAHAARSDQNITVQNVSQVPKSGLTQLTYIQPVADQPVLLGVSNQAGVENLRVEQPAMSSFCYPHRVAASTQDPHVFSLRLAGAAGQWSPSRKILLKSGDKVDLYCHSIGLGPYLNPNMPPTCASPALVIKGNERALVFPALSRLDSGGNNDLIDAYNNRTLEAGHKDAFEKMGFISPLMFCPGPNTQPAERVISLSAGIQAAGIEIGPMVRIERSTADRWTVVEGKKYKVDYVQLAKVPALKKANLDWSECREDVYSRALTNPEMNPWNSIAATFQIVFE